MDTKARYNCLVHILGRSYLPGGKRRPVGCGFICGPGFIMTCTHVIAKALDLGSAEAAEMEGREIWVRFPVERPSEARMRVASAMPVSPLHPDLVDREYLHDICVLELDGGSFPPDAVIAMPAPPLPEPPVELSGSGITEKQPDGVPLRCLAEQPLIYGRVAVTSNSVDLRVQPGCSGAPLYHGTHGLAGMISHDQQTKSGLMIPVDFLLEIPPFDRRRGAAFAAASPGGAVPEFRRRLTKELEFFDRVPQREDFKDHFDLAVERRSSLVCALAGVDADMTTLCRDRLVRKALVSMALIDQDDRHDDRPNVFDKLDLLEISFPRAAELSADQALTRLQNQLKRWVQAESLAADKMVPGINGLPLPLIVSSDLVESDFASRRYRHLVRRWASWLTGLTAGRLERPLIHFLIIHMRETRAAGRDEEPDLEPLMVRYGNILRDLNRGQQEPERIADIRLLKYFRQDEVVDWIGRIGSEAELDERSASAIETSARSHFLEEPYPRLRHVDSWVRGLEAGVRGS